MKSSIRVLAIGVTALPFVFCGVSQKASEKLAEKAIEKSTGGKVDIQQGGKKVTITTEKGESVVMGNAIPESFPKDMPLYPGATAEGGFGVTGTGPAGGTMVALKAPDDAGKVLLYYKTELPNQGWVIKTTVDNQGQGGMIVAEKAPRTSTVMVGAEAGTGGSSIVITISEKSE